MATIASLRDRGFELTNIEVDALTRTDTRLWECGAEWIDRAFSVAASTSAMPNDTVLISPIGFAAGSVQPNPSFT